MPYIWQIIYLCEGTGTPTSISRHPQDIENVVLRLGRVSVFVYLNYSARISVKMSSNLSVYPILCVTPWLRLYFSN